MRRAAPSFAPGPVHAGGHALAIQRQPHAHVRDVRVLTVLGDDRRVGAVVAQYPDLGCGEHLCDLEDHRLEDLGG